MANNVTKTNNPAPILLKMHAQLAKKAGTGCIIRTIDRQKDSVDTICSIWAFASMAHCSLVS